MSKALLTYAVGDMHRKMLMMTRPNLDDYATRHGYDYHEGELVSSAYHPSWHKLPLMLHLLGDYETVVFVGCDVLVVDGSQDIAAGLGEGDWHGLVVHDIDSMPGTPHVGMVPNCDIWVVRQPMAPWLMQMWQMHDKYPAHPWWEQAACMDLLGWQLEHPCRRVRDTELWQHTAVLDSRFNAHPYAKVDGEPYFLHATGYSTQERLRMLQEWVSELHPA